MTLIPTYSMNFFEDNDVTFVFIGGVYDIHLGKLRHWLDKPSGIDLGKSDIYVRRTK